MDLNHEKTSETVDCSLVLTREVQSGLGPIFGLETRLLITRIKSVQHYQFQQNGDPKQYLHILILCWYMPLPLMRISIPKGHA